MARPRPRAVTRLIEKIDTSVNKVTIHSVKKVPSTETAPTSRGRPAATRPPKTTTSSITTSGTASDSAVARSDSIRSETAEKTGPCPE